MPFSTVGYGYSHHLLTNVEIDLRKIKPYYFKYQTFAKGRWLGRKVIEVFNTEFRDRDNTFYVCEPPPQDSFSFFQWSMEGGYDREKQATDSLT